MTKFRVSLFRFLAFPGFLWLKVAALLVGFTWHEMVLDSEEIEKEDPPWYGGEIPERVRKQGKDYGKGKQ